MNDYDERELNRLRSQLERSAEALDPTTLVRLRAARKRALDAARGRRAPMWLPWSLATAAVLVAALGITWQWNTSQDITLAEATPEDVEVLLVKDTPDFTQDLEFYSWLEEQGAV